ncbi:MAG: hypothetical protein WCL44_06940 [bacterium]
MLSVTIIGDHPLALDVAGNLKARIGTVFLRGKALVTLPGIHAMQRNYYVDFLNHERKSRGVRPLSRDEEGIEWENSVDLIMENGTILIRPDPAHMEHAFAADELLQELVSKKAIKFLHATDSQVKQAIKERGELWRIAPLPKSSDETIDMINGARTAIGNGTIYYFNKLTGTRYLTFKDFSKLESLDTRSLARHLQEIAEFSTRQNRMGNPEVDFFLADSSFCSDSFQGRDFLKANPALLSKWYQELSKRFMKAVPVDLLEDDLTNLEWRNRMFSALVGEPSDTLAEGILQGLSPEFFMQVRWLPGARIQNGELIWDRVFDEQEQTTGCDDTGQLCDWRARNLIFNFNRDYTDVEYVNVGRIERSLSERERKMEREQPQKQPADNACRGVYIVDLKRRESEGARVRIIRMQKWGVAHHLDNNKDLLTALLLTDEYTEYILDRRLACRQLGMNLPTWLITRSISEEYHGSRKELDGITIRTHYFEREYVGGMATANIQPHKFASDEYALAFSHLLGEAAAPNIIVGRADPKKGVLFDDGDEIVVTNARGVPSSITVADHTGAFWDYDHDLDDSVQAYARPIVSRLGYVSQPDQFLEVYLNAFMARLLSLQIEYRDRRQAFDTLFKHRKPDGRGNFADRWMAVLRRLDQVDVQTLTDRIRKQILQ